MLAFTKPRYNVGFLGRLVTRNVAVIVYHIAYFTAAVIGFYLIPDLPFTFAVETALLPITVPGAVIKMISDNWFYDAKGDPAHNQ